MSLFKSKDWWSSGTVLDEDSIDLFNGSMKISQIGPEGSGDVIVIGAPNGLIQIFKPQGSYRPTDVILEYMTDHPIVQIDTGKLMPGSNLEHIAVLHPRSISIYMLSSKEGHTEYGDQNILLEQYDHKLSRTAYSLIIGPFGGIKDRDFICVQSLDGLLMFFEQDVATFSCFLPNFLIPGEMSYSNCADIFIICNSNWILEAFSYNNLSQVSDANTDNSTVAKKLVADWEYNIGENVISIQKLQTSNNICTFVILGERCLYALNDNGILKFMKKFDFDPMCAHAYLIGWYYENNARFMSMIISDTSTLLIYEETTLLWSCQLTFMPLCISRGFFMNLAGSIVMFTDYGEVKCCYLGTEPELFTAPPMPSNEVDFDEAQKELEKLQTYINSQSDTSEINLTNAASERELTFAIHIMKNFKINDHLTQNETEFFKCEVEVKLKPLNKSNLELIQVTFVTHDPLQCTNPNRIIVDIMDDISVMTEVYSNVKQPIANLNITVIVLFSNISGQIRILKKQEQLPFKLVYQPTRPQKESKYKITLVTNKPTIDLLELFNDFDPESLMEAGHSTGVVAFSSPYCENFPVTIISAKSSQRYRIQCDNISLINVVVKNFVHYLLMYFNKKKHLRDTDNTLLKITVHSGISNEIFQSFSNIIEQHLTTRQQLANVEEKLEILGSQFVLIQKRLMIKYRERPPTSCEGLAFLLEDTFTRIKESSSEIEKLKKDIVIFGCEIRCVIGLIFYLFDLVDPKIENLDNIKSALSIDALQEYHQAWEETATINALYLLRTKYAKNEKEHDKFVAFGDVSSVNNFNAKDVTKYIRLLLERVMNKYEASSKTEEGTKSDVEQSQNSDTFYEESENEFRDDAIFQIPEGSLFGQRKPVVVSHIEKQKPIQ